ncbi:MAG: hypothetical protein HQL77_07145 [Magnetococcales bacterium]|nr:hypothetical protein [Magnetococcales bacterium]
MTVPEQSEAFKTLAKASSLPVTGTEESYAINSITTPNGHIFSAFHTVFITLRVYANGIMGNLGVAMTSSKLHQRESL